MKKEIEYQKCFDVVSTIEYTGIEDGSHMFYIKRHHVDLMWDEEEDTRRGQNQDEEGNLRHVENNIEDHILELSNRE